MSRRERLTLIATILASTVVFLDGTVVNVALPAMERDLGMGLAGQQWVVKAYLLALVSLMLVGGSLGDHFGRRRIFSIGLMAFGVSSILCALARSTGVLIALRGVQGLAGAMLVPGSLAILAATFEGEARGRAIGTWTAWSGSPRWLGRRPGDSSSTPSPGGTCSGSTSRSSPARSCLWRTRGREPRPRRCEGL